MDNSLDKQTFSTEKIFSRQISVGLFNLYLSIIIITTKILSKSRMKRNREKEIKIVIK